MPLTRLVVPNLLGGVSTQPPAARFANQVAAADDVVLSVSDGLAKRQGSQWITTISGYSADDDVRLAPLTLADGVAYLLFLGPSEARVFETNGTECTVAAAPGALDYLAADAADMRITPIADSLVLTNTTMELAAETSDDYNATAAYRTYDDLAGHAPADGTVYHARTAGATRPAGFYRHDVGPETWATWQSHALGRDYWASLMYWTSEQRNPMGIKIGFVRTACAAASCSWAESAWTITKTDVFADYTWQLGDYVYLAAGTGATTPGWYEVQSKTDDDTIVLVEDAGGGGGDRTDWEIDGIGPYAQVAWDFRQDSPSSMYDVTAMLQDIFHSAGFADALVGWVPNTGAEGGSGSIKITSPYRGAGTKIHDPLAPDDDYIDGTEGGTPGRPFSSGTATAGTGAADSDTLAIDERWTQIAPPNQRGAVLSTTTLPLALKREWKTGYYGDSYDAVILDDNPWGYWRLGESAGTDAADETGRNDGTYVDSPTLGETSLVARHADTAVTFIANDVSGVKQSVNCGTLSGFGPAAEGTGASIELWMKTTDTTPTPVLAGFNISWFSGSQNLYLRIVNPGPGPGDKLEIGVRGRDGLLVAGTSTNEVTIRDGAAHHIVGTWKPNATFGLYIDGEPIAIDVYDEGGLNVPVLEEFAEVFRIGSTDPGVSPCYGFADGGTLDEVALYDYPLSAFKAHLHYRAGVSSSVTMFSLQPADFADRLSGDAISNPLPWLFDEGKTLADVAFLRGRHALAGSSHVLMGRSGEDWDFWIENSDNLGDSDPIDLSVSGTQTVDISYVVPFRKMLVVFTAAGQQYEISATETLSPSTAVNTPSTTYPSDPDVSPVVMGNKLYFASSPDSEGQIRQYRYDDAEAASEAPSITDQAAGYLPVALKSLDAAPNHNTLFALPTAGDYIYVYRYHENQGELVQSAWGRWTVDATERISDIAVVGSELYALVEGAGAWGLVKFPLVDEGALAGMPTTVHLDNRRTLTGTNDGSTTTWDFTDSDATLDTVVLGGNFADAGETVSGTTNNGSTLTVSDADGDYAGDPCYVGRAVAPSVDLSRLYRRDRNNVAILDEDLRLIAVRINYVQTAGFDVTIDQDGRSNRSYSYAPPSGTTVEDEGVYRVRFRADPAITTLTLSESSAYPWKLAGLEFDADYVPPGR